MSDDLSSSIPLLLCPYCKVRVPSLDLLPSEGTMDIVVKCKCLTENKLVTLTEFMNSINKHLSDDHIFTDVHHNLGTEEECVECLKSQFKEIFIDKGYLENYHILSESKLMMKCNQHNQEFGYYCRLCKENMCYQCFSKHNTEHKDEIIDLDGVYSSSYSLDEYDPFENNNNTQHVNDFISRLDINNETHIKMKKDIQSAHELNKSITQDLQSLYKRIRKTIEMFGNHHYYSFLELQSIVYNCTDFNCKNTNNDQSKDKTNSIETEFKQLLHHFRNQFLLKQITISPPIKVKEKRKTPFDYLFLLNDGMLGSVYQYWSTSTRSTIFSINIYDIMTYKKIQTLDAHNKDITCVIQLSDTKLVSSALDKTIKIWDLKQSKLLIQLSIKSTSAWSLLELHDGKLASGCENGSIMIWDIITDKCIATLTGQHKWKIINLVQFNDGRLVAYIENCFIIWDCKSQKCLAQLPGDGNYGVILLNDGNIVSAYRKTKSIMCWSSITYTSINTITLSDVIYKLMKLRDGRLAYCYFSYTIGICNPKTGQCVTIIYMPIFSLNSMIVLRDGRIASLKENIWIMDIGLKPLSEA